VNPFAGDIDSANYDRARPYFHPLVFRRLLDSLPRRPKISLDVACGTGHSAMALGDISELVVGLDSSAAMLRSVRQNGRVQYVRGLAEHLPFGGNSFDLVTVGLAIHWFDRDLFLSEAHRVLRHPGWLLLYESGFPGVMKENPVFGVWAEQYRARFPAPPRNDRPLSPSDLAYVGFHEVLFENFIHIETFGVDQLISYLNTQSNVLEALRTGAETRESIRRWMEAGLLPLFEGTTGTFEFRGWMRLAQTGGPLLKRSSVSG
jgi:ubiquinone/menaquinone biosynthesis C-methylase UbiE